MMIISLFSGAGGCSLGFSQAGLKPTIAAEIDPNACETYARNLSLACQPLDLAASSAPDLIYSMTGGKKIWMVIGGPPCQGFSTAGPRSPSDPRNALIYNYLEIVARIKPRWFLFENVEGLLTSNSGRDIVRLVQEMAALGYSILVEKVNFAAYGLPQTRKRVLMIGNRIGLDFALPPQRYSFDSGKAVSSLRLPFSPSLREVISDLPINTIEEGFLDYPRKSGNFTFGESLRSQSGKVNHHFSAPSNLTQKLAHMLKPGQTMKDLPNSFQHESYERRANRRVKDGVPSEKRGGAPSGIKRLHANLNSLTITSASNREFIHPELDRPLTLRECARIQSFPDSFIFAGGVASIARQIGNAIPPLAARVLAERILEADGAIGAGRHVRQVRSGLLRFRLTDANGMSPALAQTDAALRRMLPEESLPLFGASVA